MRRYKLPRLIYINKLDHNGANPWEVLDQARSKLKHHTAAVQVPIGLKKDFKELLICFSSVAYCREKEVAVDEVFEEVPADMKALVSEKRRELIETVSKVDEKLAEAFCSDKPISATDLEVCC
ncbi:putative P-loop containing nucleoside triphosphate hydrolase [Medicago truncatula]|uniref:Putative P-loop containing nucleoside triphosphate hydrolase n=1 Tax=Medicago truncatula TaxID=3880 RepID=A0A396JBQ2_MEDTR|nr:putative P-loop containing nucleoside triphosphate hydrolase [Medicago truncatula]